MPRPTAHARVDASELLPLLARCRGGDEGAWRELFDGHFDFVYRVARRLGTPAEELDDICQEVFVVVFRKLDTYTYGCFTTWLYRITANVAADAGRRRRSWGSLRERLARLAGGAPAPVVSPERQLVEREGERAIAAVLAAMAPKKRQAFVLFEIEGLSGEEVAERVGCKVETVWTRLLHARRDFERLARKKGLLVRTGEGR